MGREITFKVALDFKSASLLGLFPGPYLGYLLSISYAGLIIGLSFLLQIIPSCCKQLFEVQILLPLLFRLTQIRGWTLKFANSS